MTKQPAHKSRRRPGYFHPVPLRAREDGWSEWRQCAFLAQLYVTGSVSAAAQAVGMSRHSAYRLRQRADAEGFAAEWDRVLTRPGLGRLAGPKPDWRKVTQHTLMHRIETGLIQPVIYRGKMVTIRRKADNSALFRLLRRTSGMEPQLLEGGW